MTKTIKKPQLVTIDVDGTLVDSVPDLAYCVDQMMQYMNLPKRGEEKVRNWVGNGVERLVRRALIDQLDGEPDDKLFQQAYPFFLQCYDKNSCQRSYLYAGVKEILLYFQQKKIRLACVTNKDAQFTLPILKTLGIHDLFEIVVCGDTLAKKKPDPLPLLHIAKVLGVNPCDALMLGDSMSDVKAARAAGYQIICMSYGYNHGIDIRLSNPDVVLDSFLQIPDLFE